jgi:4-hydroxy-2-oxoheptanedioate aldolase
MINEMTAGDNREDISFSFGCRLPVANRIAPVCPMCECSGFRDYRNVLFNVQAMRWPYMQRNLIGLELKGKSPVVGLGLCLGSLRSAEIASCTGFDFAMIDMLHSHYEKASATDAIRTLASTNGPAPFGRVASNEPGAINDLLDAGATGIIVPMVNSAEESEMAVQAAFYPPAGKRSKGSPASIFYGNEYYDLINKCLKLIVMIETPESAARADEILSVPGIAGCLIGAGDLSFIMKCAKDSPEFISVIDHIINAASLHKVAAGISVNKAQEMEFWLKKGISFFLASHDLAVLNNGLRAYDADFSRYR